MPPPAAVRMGLFLPALFSVTVLLAIRHTPLLNEASAAPPPKTLASLFDKVLFRISTIGSAVTGGLLDGNPVKLRPPPAVSAELLANVLLSIVTRPPAET